MAMCATFSKVCRFFHFFRQGCCLQPNEFGEAFDHGRGKSFRLSASSPHSVTGRRFVFWSEHSFSFPSSNFIVIHHQITDSMLGGSRGIIQQEVIVARSKTRTILSNNSKGTFNSWSGVFRTWSSDLMVGCSPKRKSELSTLSLPALRGQDDSGADDGHRDSFEGFLQFGDLIVPRKSIAPRDLILGGFRTSDGTFPVRNAQNCTEPIVKIHAVSCATRPQKCRTKKPSRGGAKEGLRLTPLYVIQLLKEQKDPNLAFRFFKWAGLQRGYKHTSGTYCALIEALVRGKMFSALKQVKQEAEAKGLGSSTFLLREFGSAFSQGGLVEETIKCLKQMEDLGCWPRLWLYNKLANELVKAGFPDRALCLYGRMVDAGCRPDSYTFNNLLAGYGKMGDLVNMRRVFEEMKDQSCTMTPWTISILLNVLCKAGNVDEAWNLFVANKDLANVVVSNIMLHGLCKAGRTEQCLELFERMKEKFRLETATFNILIHGLGLANRTKDAIRLFQSMADSEMAPDVLTYNVTLKLLIKDGRFHEAYREFQEMAAKGLTPDVLTYGTLIRGFCKNGDLDSANQVFITMQASCLEALVSTNDDCWARESDVGVLTSKGSRSTFLRVYKVVCTGLCTHLLKAGRVDQAHELFQETLKLDSDMFLYAYNAAIHWLGSAGNIDEAWELYQSMSAHRCKPDVVTYNTLISSLGKAKQVDRACDLFLDMQVSGCKPDVVTCTTLVDALCKSGRAQRALDLFKEMQVQGISPNVFTYHSLFVGLCKGGQVSMAYMLYEEMINNHCSPNAVMYRSLIRGFSSADHLVNHSYRLHIEMLQKDYSLDPLTSYMLVRSLRRTGKTDEALHVFRLSREGKR